jgi:undecaprenyl phosphate N,N'-diacetylbacillosamine 1-phosphate transferase
MIYRTFLKNIFDFLLALLLIILLIPIFLIIWLLIYFRLGTPVLFVQERPGKKEKIFKIYKFRTMTDEKDLAGNLKPDGERMTKLGNFLRNSSLDEIPQLFNVLKGDVSFVGPRPLLIEYLELYNEFQKERHKVKPGITGWAQVNGRNNISWGKKIELDIWYVNHISFNLDLKILFLTLFSVLNCKGVNKDGYSTTTAFNGRN